MCMKQDKYRQTDDFKSLCQPIIDKLNPSFIRFTRLFRQGHMRILTTRPDAVEWYFNEGACQFGANERPFDAYQSGFALTDSWVESQDKIDNLIKPLQQYFNMGAELSFYQCYGSHTDIFELAMPATVVDPNSQLMRHVAFIEKVIQHRLRPSALIQNDALGLKLSTIDKGQGPLSAIIPATEGQAIQRLTRRELDCAYWFSQGKSIPEMAMILSISPRTVEKYVNHLKAKLNAYSPFQLGLLIGKYYPHFKTLFNELKLSVCA